MGKQSMEPVEHLTVGARDERTTAQLGPGDAQLDALFAQARASEADGRLGDALTALTVAAAELTLRGETDQYPFAWMAQLESALGHHAAAEELERLVRDLELEAEGRVDRQIG